MSKIETISKDAVVTGISKPYGSKYYLTLKGYDQGFAGARATKVVYDAATDKITYSIGKGTIPSAMWTSIRELEARYQAVRV